MRVHGIVVISGANRGIGFEITKALIDNPNVKKVYAGVRDLTKAEDLKSLSDPEKKLSIIELDISKNCSVKEAADFITNENGNINILVNNAAILEKDHLAGIPNGERDSWQRHFDINVTSQALMIQSFMPLLQEAITRNETASIINISGFLGSIAQCPGTSLIHGNYAYMCTKAALNMLTKITSVEFPSILSVSMCPGWNQTDMGGPNATEHPSTTAPVLLETVDGLEIKKSGLFLDRKGEPIPF